MDYKNIYLFKLLKIIGITCLFLVIINIVYASECPDCVIRTGGSGFQCNLTGYAGANEPYYCKCLSDYSLTCTIKGDNICESEEDAFCETVDCGTDEQKSNCVDPCSQKICGWNFTYSCNSDASFYGDGGYMCSCYGDENCRATVCGDGICESGIDDDYAREDSDNCARDCGGFNFVNGTDGVCYICDSCRFRPVGSVYRCSANGDSEGGTGDYYCECVEESTSACIIRDFDDKVVTDEICADAGSECGDGICGTGEQCPSDCSDYVFESIRRWSHSLNQNYYTDPIVADVDNDGVKEIIIGDSLNVGQDSTEKVYVFGHDGSLRSGWPKEIPGAGHISVGDIDNDGEDEIFVGDENGRLHAFNKDGSYVPGWPVQTDYISNMSAEINTYGTNCQNGCINGACILDDFQLGDCIDSDGQLNYFVKGTITDNDGMNVDYCNGNTVSEYFCNFMTGKRDQRNYSCNYGCNDGACLENTNGTSYYGCIETDGGVNYFSASTVNLLSGESATDYCTGDHITEYYCSGGVRTYKGKISAKPVIADLNQDGNKEVIVGIRDLPALQTNGLVGGNNFYVFNHDGTVAEGWPITMPLPELGYRHNFLSEASVKDIDGDGDLEIFSASTEGTVFGWYHNGTLIPGWPQSVDKRPVTNPLIVEDIDNNGDYEIIVSSDYTYRIHNGDPAADTNNLANYRHIGNNLYMWDSIPLENGMIHIFDHDGNNHPGWPIELPYGHNVYEKPYVVDLDNDGDREIVIAVQVWIIVYRQDLVVYNSNYSNYIYVWDDNGTLEWSRQLIDNDNRQYKGEKLNILDLNNDGYKEIYLVGYSQGDFGNFGPYYGPNIHSFFGFDHEGNNLPGYPFETSDFLQTDKLWFDDLDKDGKLEIVQKSLSSISGDLELMIYGTDIQAGDNSDDENCKTPGDEDGNGLSDCFDPACPTGSACSADGRVCLNQECVNIGGVDSSCTSCQGSCSLFDTIQGSLSSLKIVNSSVIPTVGHPNSVFSLNAYVIDVLDITTVEAHLYNEQDELSAVVSLVDDGTDADTIAGDHFFSGSINSSNLNGFTYSITIAAQNSIGQTTEYENAASFSISTNNTRSLMPEKTIFIVNDRDWRNVLPLVSTTIWTDANTIHKYPTLIYHSEESDTERYDPDSTINFIQQYEPTQVYVVGGTEPNFDNLLVTDPELGAGLSVDQITRINPQDLMSFWDIIAKVVYVEDNYETAIYASLLASINNAPLIIEGTESDTEQMFGGRKVLCVGSVTPAGTACEEQYNLSDIQAHLLSISPTDKIVLINPNDLDIAVSTTFYPDKASAGIHEIFSGASLGAPFIAAAKNQIIITTTETDYDAVDSFLGSEITRLQLIPEYLTIVANPNAISVKKTMPNIGSYNNFKAVDHLFYADLDQDEKPDIASGRIRGLTISDVSALIARSLFYHNLPRNANVKFMASSFSSAISRSNVRSQEFSDSGYNSQSVTSSENCYNFNPNEWNTQHLISYQDHGSSAWAGISSTSMPELTNSFVYNDACSTCSKYSVDSFCDLTIRNGGMAHMGALGIAWTGNYIYGKTMNNIYYHNMTLGKAFLEAYKISGLSKYDWMTTMIGDPTLEINPEYMLDSTIY